MGSLLQNIQFAIRILLKSPGITSIIILFMGLAIGVNTSIFSLVDAILLRPLPVEKPDRLMALYTTSSKGGTYSSTSYPDYVDYRDHNEVFSDLSAFSSIPISLSNGNQSERIWGEIVSINYFSVVGVKPAVGRTLMPFDDTGPGASPIVVISHDLWRRLFDSSDGAIGSKLLLNDQTYTVVGVAPMSFRGVSLESSPDVWVPLSMYEEIKPGFRDFFDKRDSRWLDVIGRLKPNITREQAQASIGTLARQLEETYPKENEGWGATLIPAQEATVWPENRGSVIRFMSLLMAVVVLVLFIACANVANLLLTRATARRREIAIRMALGARPRHIVQQLLVEGVLLSLAGGALGFMLAKWSSDLLFKFNLPDLLPAGVHPSLDSRVLIFTFIVSFLTGIVFALAPSLSLSRSDITSTMKSEASILIPGQRRINLRSLLVSFQIALSVVLLIGAGLFVKSLQKAKTVNLGFETKDLLITSLDLGLQGYDEGKGEAFYSQLINQVRSLPGVQAVGLARMVPLGQSRMSKSVVIEGQELPPGKTTIEIATNIVGSDYFRAMSIPILRGRDFNDRDSGTSQKAAIINETMARRFWPDQDPVGKNFRLASRSGPAVEIIGLVQDAKYRTLQESPRAFVYLPLLQHYQPQMTIHVRTNSNPDGLIGAIRQQVHTLDPNLPVFDVMTMNDHIARVLSQPRMAAMLLSIFGFLALLLAMGGTYAVLAFYVEKRVREIGIRMALGAQPIAILKLIIMEGMILVVIGLAVGLVGAFASTRLIATLLYEVSPTDSATFVATSMLLIGTTLVGSYIPARKATKVDPMTALRYE